MVTYYALAFRPACAVRRYSAHRAVLTDCPDAAPFRHHDPGLLQAFNHAGESLFRLIRLPGFLPRVAARIISHRSCGSDTICMN